MKRTLAFVFALLGWFALIAQYCLMLKNSVLNFNEMTIQFFSYFTILTNLMVAIYFTNQALKKSDSEIKSGLLTAITIYILIVGMVYQVALRSTWNPTGLQRIVDELLHSIIPVLVIIYWHLYENKKNLQYKQMALWAIYPLFYLFYILIRGSFSKFYPYPFVNVTELGLNKVFINAFFILLFFLALSFLFIRIGKASKK
ncbi:MULTISPECIES: Pr6Pr family membrane protein [unclassified Chryseobacterium]|uniref:Pr6Pr family membrane protein n=1 Tax=unclassified Chryseobacterium TaxID=2593645 RepID=UPI00226A05B5|nr:MULTISPECIES: Pr6Pr family membrane protein [unclassified Chryseobacterium]